MNIHQRGGHAQAYIPAQEEKTQEKSRIPCPHAHPWWAEGPQGPSAEGAQETDGLIHRTFKLFQLNSGNGKEISPEGRRAVPAGEERGPFMAPFPVGAVRASQWARPLPFRLFRQQAGWQGRGSEPSEASVARRNEVTTGSDIAGPGCGLHRPPTHQGSPFPGGGWRRGAVAPEGRVVD